MGADNLEWKIGNVTVTRIVEVATTLEPSQLLPACTPEALAAHLDWLRPWSVDDDGLLLLSIHALVVQSGDRRIVVDTCIGNRPLPGLGDGMGIDDSFLNAMTDAGFARESIDTVICTHLHFDHVGWNTMLVDGEWVPTFPSARYLLVTAEWEHWNAMSQAERATSPAITIDDAVSPLFSYDVVDLVDVDHRVTDELALVHTPGHTPGHVSVRITSQGEEALITGDCIHHPIQWAELDWGIAADTNSHEASATRRRIVAEYADRPALVIGTHFPAPTAGHLVTTDGGVRFRALP